MDTMPQIRLVFILTKNDSADFDREAVTQSLCIVPSKTSAPRLSKGELSCDVADINEVKSELSGITILPTVSSSYQNPSE